MQFGNPLALINGTPAVPTNVLDGLLLAQPTVDSVPSAAFAQNPQYNLFSIASGGGTNQTPSAIYNDNNVGVRSCILYKCIVSLPQSVAADSIGSLIASSAFPGGLVTVAVFNVNTPTVLPPPIEFDFGPFGIPLQAAPGTPLLYLNVPSVVTGGEWIVFTVSAPGGTSQHDPVFE